MTRIIKTRNKQRTQARILEATGEIIEQFGIHAVGINEVARVSGHNKVLIYRYFGDLDGLLSRYIQTVLIERVRQQVTWLGAANGTEDNSSNIVKLLGELAASQQLVCVLQWEISQVCTERAANIFVTQLFYRALIGPAARKSNNCISLIMCSAFIYLILQSGMQAGPLGRDFSNESEFESLRNAVEKILKNCGPFT
ncbi:transcriptional regulator, TetR family [Dyadobacter koreensis]|uniref:Transcriptional regulator, TetR family n=1 Tax=Dyadobacter koreensis TaxID=408657 RepID=A0A1H6QGY5_9BACT|nr:TetR/AcrR family transcriptional regulator [Dyadobacter koreensis]SEI39477.1 transcriptional regulator, TetR family [Dyadobacter koreensis]